MKHPIACSRSPRRRAMTVIELLTVMSIAAILAGISLPVLIQGFAKARISTASERILRAQGIAHELALAQPAPGPGEAVQSYGVRLETVNGRGVATVVFGTRLSDTLFADDDQDGVPDAGMRPLASFPLPPGTAIWIDDGNDSATAPTAITPRQLDTVVGWFLQPGTGMPVRNGADPADSLRRDPHLLSIGVPGKAATRSVWMTSTGNSTTSSSSSSAKDLIERATPAVLAPQDIYLRHLSVRNTGGRQARAIAIYAVGMVSDQEWP